MTPNLLDQIQSGLKWIDGPMWIEWANDGSCRSKWIKLDRNGLNQTDVD